MIASWKYKYDFQLFNIYYYRDIKIITKNEQKSSALAYTYNKDTYLLKN